MGKQEFVQLFAEKLGTTKAEAARSLEAFIECTQEVLKESGKLALVGFGTFEAKKRPAREGRNPQTNEKVQIPERIAISFKAGSKLKDYLN